MDKIWNGNASKSEGLAVVAGMKKRNKLRKVAVTSLKTTITVKVFTLFPILVSSSL